MNNYVIFEEARTMGKLARIHMEQDKAERRRNALRFGWSDETVCEVASEFGNAFRILIAKWGFKDFCILASIWGYIEPTGEA